MEIAIAELFEDGELLRHTRRMRRVYAARRDVLAGALKRHLGGALAFDVPDGGTGIWTDVDPAIDALGWEAAGEREGVILQNSRVFHFAQRDAAHFRLGFSYLDETELVEAVRRMARALTRARTWQLAAVRTPQAESSTSATTSPVRHRNAVASSTR
jgi:GntR family transcriptional regulator/MocR family aminotransferase